MAFQLPPKVSSQKVQLSEGRAYVFRHTEFGQIGRVVLRGHPDGRTIASAEVTGDVDDPMTAKRRAIFEPIGNELVKALEDAMVARGRPAAESMIPPPPPIPGRPKQIGTKMFNCKKCGANVGLLIFANVGNDKSVLEDAAMIMHKKIIEFNVPTWVIGEISGQGNPMKNKAKILKVHPQREPVFEASPEEFNPMLEALEDRHCK